MEETTDMLSSAPEGELRPPNGSYGERDFEKYKHNFFMYVWHRISLLEKIIYVEGNALKCLICVGETAVAEIFSDIKGLEEVRETPVKRQREGGVDNRKDHACPGMGCGGYLCLQLSFALNLKLP